MREGKEHTTKRTVITFKVAAFQRQPANPSLPWAPALQGLQGGSCVRATGALAKQDPGSDTTISDAHSVSGAVLGRQLLLRMRPEGRSKMEDAQAVCCTVSGVAGQPRKLERSNEKIHSKHRRPRKPSTGSPTERQRNYNRGLRSEEAQKRRKAHRSEKRNLARKSARQAKAGPRAPAQEPPGSKPGKKLVWKGRWKVATFNPRGVVALEKRPEIEHWMKIQEIDLATLTVTHEGGTGEEEREDSTWYFSGNVTGKTRLISTGVAIEVRNELRN